MIAMGAAWMRSRGDLRASWKAVVAIALLVGIGGGVALTALVGARRTQTSMQRFLAYNQPEDLVAVINPSPALFPRVLRLPEVASVTQMPYLFVSMSNSRFDGVGTFGVIDDVGLHIIERPLVVRGRLARVDEPSEVVVDEAAARQRHLHIGSRLPVYAYSAKQLSAANAFFAPSAPRGPQFVTQVVGIVRQPTSVTVVPVRQDVSYEATGLVYFTPAFVRRYAASLQAPLDRLAGTEIVRVRLGRGAADLASFRRGALAVAGDHVQIQDGSDTRVAANAAQRGIAVEAWALLVFGALALIATIGVVGQILARQIRADARDNPTLGAMGMTRRQLLARALARPVVVAIVGAGLAVVIAVALSPLTPIGLARQAEIHPGVTFNLAVTAGGFFVIVGAVVLCALVPAFTASSAARPARNAARPRVRGWNVSGRLGYRPVVPITMASNLSGDRSQAALRKRGAALALVAAIASVTAVLTFSTNLAHLIDTPRLQGWNFDVLVGNKNTQTDQQARGVRLLAKNPLVGGFSSIGSTFTGLTIDGQQVDVVGIDAVRGGVYPVILEGRPPTTPDEIMLASHTIAALHRTIGDRVRVAVGTHQASLRIVGRMMNTSAGDVLTGRLDQGGVVTLDALRRLAPTNTMVTLFVVNYAPGADQHAGYMSLQRDFGHVVLRHIAAQDVENVGRVAALPALLAALVALLAVAALAHALVTGVGRGRKDLAIARACGFVRRQLAATVLWQTWWLTLAGLVVGVPLGIIIGRSAWKIVAEQIGTTVNPIVPALAIVLVIPAVLIGTSATAAIPAWKASRVAPATALRGE
ncbi:MAG: hypothetical protein JWL83_406 [Actinomycetia bacterium]|nr:hypothetical protein [Actinomycetes bacterium]